MRLTLILFSLLFLNSCTKASSSDGYRFEEKEFERESLSISLILYNSHIKLLDAAFKLGIPSVSDKELQAFTEISLNSDSCTIHLVDPTEDYQPEFLGHEVAHCIWGRWHPNQD